MALLLNDPSFMQGWWDAAKKTDDNRAVYTFEEIENMWFSGFIDTLNISLNDWMSATAPYKAQDGKYYFDYDQLVSLDQYRYKGEVRIPFDPMKLENGKYTEESIDMLFDLTISLSCSFSKEDLKKYAEEYKRIYRDQNNFIVINDNARIQLAVLLEDYPSPLRNLEVLLDNLFSLAEAYLEEQGIDIAKVAQVAQQSMFSKTPTSSVEQKAHDLKNLTKAKPKEATAAPEKDVGGVNLKDIKRSRRGMRG